MSIDNCIILDLPKIPDLRGSLTFIETDRHVPFAIKRIYYLYDVPSGVERGGHAHKSLKQLIVAASGSFEVSLDDGKNKKSILLNRPDQGLYLCPMIWRELHNFSAGAFCLVLASEVYDESDYHRNYADFMSSINTR